MNKDVVRYEEGLRDECQRLKKMHRHALIAGHVVICFGIGWLIGETAEKLNLNWKKIMLVSAAFSGVLVANMFNSYCDGYYEMKKQHYEAILNAFRESEEDEKMDELRRAFEEEHRYG